MSLQRKLICKFSECTEYSRKKEKENRSEWEEVFCECVSANRTKSK